MLSPWHNRGFHVMQNCGVRDVKIDDLKESVPKSIQVRVKKCENTVAAVRYQR